MKKNLRNSFPLIKRVRGYRLYTQNGEKYLDFCQQGGAAILGSKPRGFSLALKNEIEKSNYYNYPSHYLKKISKAIFKLSGLSENSLINIAYFKTRKEAREHISKIERKNYSLRYSLHYSMDKEISPDFSHDVSKKNNFIYLWFPFCGQTLGYYLENCDYVLPVLPLPGDFAPIVLLSKKNVESNYVPSPVLLAGLNSIIYSLIKFMEEDPYINWREYTSMLNKIWEVKGPYLIPVYEEYLHESIFSSFLKNKIVIQPCYGRMSALPSEISEGERILFLETAYNVIRSLPHGTTGSFNTDR